MISDLVIFGIVLVLMGSGQFLFRHKWAASMVETIRAFKVKRLSRLSEEVVLRIGVVLMAIFVALGVVLIVVGLTQR
ncbi:hypothetical protein GCM10009655_14620 [Rhodoglobus aureus]|uniref:Uncharacterized protein n=1 Tax=Rhodoglobus aureus TaxID=191497 RepID=A0ABN1VLU8_9MICO